MTTESIPQQPYLLRALHEWITDNGHTPYLIVDATADQVLVPSEHVQDGKITLNVSYAAVRGLEMSNELVGFEARFSGTPYAVQVPMAAVRGIYARETGRGMIFPVEEAETSSSSADAKPGKSNDDRPPPGDRSHLKVIK